MKKHGVSCVAVPGQSRLQHVKQRWLDYLFHRPCHREQTQLQHVPCAVGAVPGQSRLQHVKQRWLDYLFHRPCHRERTQLQHVPCAVGAF